VEEDTVDDFNEGEAPYHNPDSLLRTDFGAMWYNIGRNDGYNNESLRIVRFLQAMKEG
jgi:hypothetical protein